MNDEIKEPIEEVKPKGVKQAKAEAPKIEEPSDGRVAYIRESVTRFFTVAEIADAEARGWVRK